MKRLPVTFFYPYPEELAQLDTLDLDDWTYWSGPEVRRRAWILQTYLRLRQHGYDVAISDQLPENGIVVVIPELESSRAFLSQYHRRHRRLLVLTVRADVAGFRSLLADAEIVQNGKYADGKRIFFIPHWPQPGLIPRDPARGSAIRTISFKGFLGSLRQDFRSEPFLRFLQEKGLAFADDIPQNGATPPWHDYSEVDLLLAVRPDFGGMRCEKPASKLVNAWFAGVPALVGPEYAFRELRRSALDFIEIDSVEAAIAEISDLIAHPERYQAMIENGLRRAEAFTPDKITQQWAEVLFERLPEIAAQRRFRLSRPVPLQARRALNFVMMPPSPFEFRKQVGHLVRHARGRLSNSA